ncbi:MAG: DUF488 domain-containing protein [Gammaproteobacteria bacterium]
MRRQPASIGTVRIGHDHQAKRIYDKPASSDGYRVLIDRVWPRGMRKEQARVDAWRRELAPSSQLRKWFKHDPGKWADFKRRYFEELDNNQAAIEQLAASAREQPLTLLFAARGTKFNNAVALKEYRGNRNMAQTLPALRMFKRYAHPSHSRFSQEAVYEIDTCTGNRTHPGRDGCCLGRHAGPGRQAGCPGS